MAEYKITIARSACKELQALALDMAERVLQRIESLSVNPVLQDARSLAAQLIYGGFESAITASSIGLTIPIASSMSQWSGIEEKYTDRKRY